MITFKIYSFSYSQMHNTVLLITTNLTLKYLSFVSVCLLSCLVQHLFSYPALLAHYATDNLDFGSFFSFQSLVQEL